MYEILYGCLLFPYQGTFGKVKAKNGKNVDEYLSQRCCNCILDWCERGPRKQSCNVIPFKHRWNPFKLAPNFFTDPYGLNDLLLQMLSVNPKERPTVHTILNHHYFTGYQNPLTTLIGCPLEKIQDVCTENTLGSEVFDLSVELYAKSMKIKRKSGERDYRLYACIWIACKIVKRPFPKFGNFHSKILDMEKILCDNLNYKLHHT